MLNTERRIVECMRDVLIKETNDFLEQGEGDISDMTLIFGSYRVRIPMMMPETNEATTDYLAELVKALNEYKED